MNGEEFKLGMRVRIGKGRNLWRVEAINTANGGGVLPKGTVGSIGVVAIDRPDHGVNGGSNRGAFRQIYATDFHRLTHVPYTPKEKAMSETIDWNITPPTANVQVAPEHLLDGDPEAPALDSPVSLLEESVTTGVIPISPEHARDADILTVAASLRNTLIAYEVWDARDEGVYSDINRPGFSYANAGHAIYEWASMLDSVMQVQA